jgi:Ca-activated chloride channel family protein
MKILSRITLVLLIASFIASCSPSSISLDDLQPSETINIKIVYSPEKEAWLTERSATFNQNRVKVNNKIIQVEAVNQSSGAARTDIKTGKLQTTIWSPSSSTWLEVLKQETGNQNIAVSTRPMLLTPVVISMWRPMAEAMGWPDTPIGWGDMLELSRDPQGWGRFGHPEWGRFSWGHTDPEISTTALSTLIAEFYAATNKQQGLTVADVQSAESQQFIRDLGQSIRHYGYNTLVFSDNMEKFGMSYISAFPMEEITLIDFNKYKNPTTPLVAIYPKEGTFWHDDPFILMANASQEEQLAAEQFFNFLMTVDSQKLAMQYGFRPANPDVALADPISTSYGVQPAGPQTTLQSPPAEVIVAAKNTWAQNRKRADIVLVVDISGSMEEEGKLDLVKAGLGSFLTRILPEDRVGLVTFSSNASLAVEPKELGENRIALDDAIFKLRGQGRTAIYDALLVGKDALDALPPTDDNRIRAIVLLTDGLENGSETTFDQLRNEFEESGISIFPVAYGTEQDQADASQTLEGIVEFSRTILVQGGTGDIIQIFDNLSRYF